MSPTKSCSVAHVNNGVAWTPEDTILLSAQIEAQVPNVLPVIRLAQSLNPNLSNVEPNDFSTWSQQYGVVIDSETMGTNNSMYLEFNCGCFSSLSVHVGLPDVVFRNQNSPGNSFLGSFSPSVLDGGGCSGTQVVQFLLDANNPENRVTFDYTILLWV